MRAILVFGVLVLGSISHAIAQQSDSLAQPRIGVVLGGLFASHNTTFDCYLGGPNCGTFQGNTAITASVQAFADIPIRFAPGFWFSPRLSYRNYSATLHSQVLTDSTRTVNGTYVTITKQGHYDASLIGIGIAPGVTAEPFRGFHLGLLPGITYLLGPQSTQTEELLTPQGVTFTENGKTTRTVLSGTIVPFNRWLFELSGIAGFMHRFTPRLALGLEVSWTTVLNSVSSDIPWHTSGIGVGVTAAYVFPAQQDTTISPQPIVKTIDTQIVVIPPITPQPPAPKPKLTVKIAAHGLDSAGKEYDDPIIEIEEAIWRYNVPLIPYIFFDSASAQIPPRYVRLKDAEASKSFSIGTLPYTNALDIHRHLLNIVGERLRANKRIVATVAGSLDATERNNAGARDLAIARATSVRDYLVTVWGISPDRITIDYRPIPLQPSYEGGNEGREENRRVEMSFSDQSVTAPIVVQRLAKIASPPAIRFIPEINADTAVTVWNITVEQGDRQLLRFDGTGESSTLKQSKLWPLGDLRIARDTTPVEYHLTATDTTGQTATATGAFHVQERIRRQDNMPALLEFDLVGFTYNSIDLSGAHRTRLLEALASLTRGSTIQITGYTDKTGEARYNQLLSLDRAHAVQENLKKLIKQNRLQNITVTAQGLGSQEELFNNALPEGRLLSRMVRITIRRPSR